MHTTSRVISIVAVVIAFLGGALIANAKVTTGLDPESGAAACPAGYGLENFESGANGSPIVNTIPGVKFTATDGHNWLTGGWGPGYNGKYPSGSYTSGGQKWAWLGASQSSGIIDFTAGKASYVSIYTSTCSGLVLDAYTDDGTFLESSGWATNNINTGKMTMLSINRPTADIGYVIVHDTGNFWLIDWLCTDAAGVGAPITVNHPPTLSFPETSPDGLLENDGIQDNKGTADKTLFNFDVIYTDEDNDAPLSVKLVVQKVNQGGFEDYFDSEMAPFSPQTDYANGKIYTFERMFPKGDYRYGFKASDGVSDVQTTFTEFTVGYSNVAFLPGLQASRLYKIQTFENQLWEPNRNDDVKKLYMNSDGTSSSAYVYTKDVIDAA